MCDSFRITRNLWNTKVFIYSCLVVIRDNLAQMNVLLLMDGGECYTRCAQSMCRIPVLPVACEIERTGDKYAVLGRNTMHFKFILSISFTETFHNNLTVRKLPLLLCYRMTAVQFNTVFNYILNHFVVNKFLYLRFLLLIVLFVGFYYAYLI